MNMTVHIHGQLLPKNKESDIYITDGHISFEKVKDAKTVVKNGYIVPGLVDSHAHLSLGDSASTNAKAHLRAGVLAIREPGSPDYQAKKLHVKDGYPRIQTAGRFLTPHGKYFPGLAKEIHEDDLPDAAADEFKKSGAWVKVIGDFFNEHGNMVPNFPLPILKKTVETVHKLGGRIATHVVCVDAIERAIEAGFDSIEHGTTITEVQLKEMAKKNIAFTPTMTIRKGILEIWKESGSADEYKQTEKAVKHQADMVRMAFDMGIQVLAGTDAGMVAHGIVAEEIGNFIDAGVDPELALGAGSWNARAYLGYKGIEEGADADLVVFDKNPLKHPDVLKNPAYIILDGRDIRE
jgi:imidazolonepropionase-like amidohydrolase